LSYNYLLITGVQGTSFAKVLGEMDLLPILGLNFNTYFPIVVSVICFLFLFNVIDRLLSFCNITKFRFEQDFSHTSVEEGRELIEKGSTFFFSFFFNFQNSFLSFFILVFIFFFKFLKYETHCLII
jgi:hypothetical protein